ncbi:MAG TPA: hypothetical protein VI382_06475, partial [Candidatus Manganitrophaceae bacterium]|nr:hypothetical protein [Candidatus Manganitrophaceae bacterium]
RPSPEARQWASVAADELKFGLPLFEANHWMLQFGKGESDHAGLNRNISRAESLFRRILEENADQPDRILEIQHHLDGLYVARRLIENTFFAKTRSDMMNLHTVMILYFVENNQWPEAPVVSEEAAKLTKELRIKNYTRDRLTYRLLLENTGDRSEILLEGNDSGSKVTFLSKE